MDRCTRHALVALAVCLLPGAAAAQITVQDDRGAPVVFAAVPKRIVSLVPSLTESVCALGACSSLVGTDRFSNWPAEVAALPKLGGLDEAQIERIVGLKPDVVLAAPSARVIERLEALGVRVLVLEARDHAGVARTLDLLARLLGRPGAADAVRAESERGLSAAAARVPASLRGQRVYFEIDSTPYAAGAGSFLGQTLARLGLRNALPAELGPFPKLNPEYVVALQPDIVMAARRELASMPGRPGWSALAALRSGRTCGFAEGRFDVLVRPGPRLGEAAGLLADCLAALPAAAPRR